MFPRAISSASYNPVAEPAAEGGSSQQTDEAAPAGTALAATTDPIANFAATNGVHQVLQPGRGGWNGRHTDSPRREDVPLYAGKKDVRAPANNVVAKCAAPTVKASYDVANTSQDEIDALKNATCGTKSELDKLHRLGHTIENAKAAYKDLTNQRPPAKVFVTTSAGNSGQPVLIVTGPNFDPKKAKTVYTHYHGDNATVADPLGSKAGQNARIRTVITGEDKQAVFVLPEAQNTTPEVDSPTNNKDQPGVSWGNVKSQVQTTDDALKAAGLTFDKNHDKSVVSMHSGGGMALVNMMWADSKGNNLRADRLELYDCVYHFNSGDKDHPIKSEEYIRNWGKTANGQKCEQVIFYRAGNKNPQALTRVIAEGFPPGGGKDRVKFYDMGDEDKIVKGGKIDDSIDPIARDSNGQTFPRGKGSKAPLARNFDTDSHYRTVGQFLGSKPRPEVVLVHETPAAKAKPGRPTGR